MNKPNPIKPFKTLEKEAHFWETHDISPIFTNPKTSLKDLPLIESEKEEVMTVRIQKSVKSQINSIARQKGIASSTLSRMWIIEKLQEFKQKTS